MTCVSATNITLYVNYTGIKIKNVITFLKKKKEKDSFQISDL